MISFLIGSAQNERNNLKIGCKTRIKKKKNLFKSLENFIRVQTYCTCRWCLHQQMVINATSAKTFYVWLYGWALKQCYYFNPWLGAVARSEACLLGMQAAPSSIPTSGTFFCWDLVMKIFLWPFSLFRWFKNVLKGCKTEIKPNFNPHTLTNQGSNWYLAQQALVFPIDTVVLCRRNRWPVWLHNIMSSWCCSKNNISLHNDMQSGYSDPRSGHTSNI